MLILLFILVLGIIATATLGVGAGILVILLGDAIVAIWVLGKGIKKVFKKLFHDK